MTDPLHGLRTLVDLPPSPPPPMDGLRQRVEARRVRRRLVRSSLAGVALVVAVVPLVDRPSDAPTQVVAAATGSTLTLDADKDCAYVRSPDGVAPLAGGCPADAPSHSVQTFWPAVPVGDGRNATIVRGGPSMGRFAARLADGRTVEGDLGAHGWALVVTDGRIVGVSGTDVDGHPVPEWIVR